MACLCGDTHCPSCGPAQGNFRCPLCDAWADDGCEHLETVCTVCGTTDVDDATSGGESCGAHGHTVDVRLKPECQAELERVRAAEQAIEDATELADAEYWAGQEAAMAAERDRLATAHASELESLRILDQPLRDPSEEEE